MTEQMNLLPALTWNHLNVNHAPKEAALPEPPAEGWGQADTVWDPLPDGVTDLPEIPEICQTITGGAGRSILEFVRNNANVRRVLRVSGRSEMPLLLTHTLTKECHAAISDIVIHAERGSCLTLVEVVRGAENAGGIAVSLLRVYAEEGSHVRLIQLQMLSDDSRRWSSVGVIEETDAKVELHRAELGGNLAVCGSLAKLIGRRSEYDTHTIYFGNDNAILDFSDVSGHSGRETVSEIHAAGALAGRSKKTLRGTIDFRRGAVHAVGHESEDVLLLSPEVRNRTAPLILCGEEQVEGQHAATAGRVDEDILYYMASRGLGEVEAKRLMIMARFAPVLDQIPLPNLKCEITDFIERRLSRCAGI